MPQIYRSGKDIYDAQTNQRISSPEVLARDYKGAVEVNGPVGSTQNISNSTPIIRPGQYGLSDWKGYQALKDAASEIIKIRQGANKDIVDPTSYWKGQQRTASDLSDPRLKELSPADQAALRLSKQGTASAALYALDQERAYREKVGGSVMDNITKMYENQAKEKESEANRKYREDQLAIDRYNAGMTDPYNTTPKGPVVTDINSFANALSGQESGGNYNAKNTRTGAAGKFQILPSNWPSWSSAYARDVLNKSMRELPNTPENQDAVAKYKMQEYFNKYGNWEDVASMWYSGKPLSQVEKEGWADKKMGGGKEPSVREYVNSVMGRLQQPTVTGKKNNNLSQDEMRALSVMTGIDLALIPQMTNQEVVNATRKASVETETSSESFADSFEGKKVGAIDGLSREDLVILFDLVSGGLTAEEKTKLFKLGITQATLDAATNLIAPSSSTSGTRDGIKV